jgi:hypothetical protein
MSRTLSRLAVSLLVGAGLVLAAGPAGASSTTVSFTGSSPLGLAALACGSKPDRSSVTLTSTDALNVQNLTGHRATIYINGKKSGSSLETNQSAPITSANGYSVSLLPDCLLNLNDASSVSVTIVAPRTVAPAPVIAPTATSAATSNDGSPQSTRPSNVKSASPKRSAGRSTASPSTSSGTSASTAPRSGTKPHPSATTSGSAAPTGSSGGANGSSTSDPSGSNTDGSNTDGSNANDPNGTSVDGTTQAAGSPDGVSIGAAQALPASESIPATPNYLLVVIAFILVIGVGWASLRAVFSQRRTRRAAA